MRHKNIIVLAICVLGIFGCRKSSDSTVVDYLKNALEQERKERIRAENELEQERNKVDAPSPKSFGIADSGLALGLGLGAGALLIGGIVIGTSAVRHAEARKKMESSDYVQTEKNKAENRGDK
jgi:hypothetical protein